MLLAPRAGHMHCTHVTFNTCNMRIAWQTLSPIFQITNGNMGLVAEWTICAPMRALAEAACGASHIRQPVHNVQLQHSCSPPECTDKVQECSSKADYRNGFLTAFPVGQHCTIGSRQIWNSTVTCMFRTASNNHIPESAMPLHPRQYPVGIHC